MLRLPFLLALFVFFALGLALIVRVPMGASPDESAHWQYIEYLVANKTLPVFKGEVPPAPGYEFHQPPLYYVTSAPGWAILPAGVSNYWARLVSLFCGAATLFLIWKSARLLFPNAREIAVLSTGLAALWPLHLGVSAGANNDAMAGLWAAALFWIGARVLLQGASWRDAALLGVFVGLGALTKNTVLVVGVAALGALVMAPRAQGKAPSPLVGVLVALATLTLIAGPLWARNTLLYGDPFALKLFSQAATKGTPGLAQLPFDPFFTLVYWRGMIWLLFLTGWGFFGGPNNAVAATAPFNFDGPVVRQVWLLPFIAALALVPLAALWSWKRPRAPIEISPRQKRVFRFWFLGISLVVLAWIQFAYGHFSGGQARYLHGALLPMCVILSVGWRGLWGNGRALCWASLGVAAVLVTLNLLNLFYWKTLV